MAKSDSSQALLFKEYMNVRKALDSYLTDSDVGSDNRLRERHPGRVAKRQPVPASRDVLSPQRTGQLDSRPNNWQEFASWQQCQMLDGSCHSKTLNQDSSFSRLSDDGKNLFTGVFGQYGRSTLDSSCGSEQCNHGLPEAVGDDTAVKLWHSERPVFTDPHEECRDESRTAGLVRRSELCPEWPPGSARTNCPEVTFNSCPSCNSCRNCLDCRGISLPRAGALHKKPKCMSDAELFISNGPRCADHEALSALLTNPCDITCDSWPENAFSLPHRRDQENFKGSDDICLTTRRTRSALDQLRSSVTRDEPSSQLGRRAAPCENVEIEDKPDSSQIAGRLMQIRDCIRRTKTMITKTDKSADTESRDKRCKLLVLLEDLKKQECDYLCLLQKVLEQREDELMLRQNSIEHAFQADDSRSEDAPELEFNSDEGSEREPAGARKLSRSAGDSCFPLNNERPMIESHLGHHSDTDGEQTAAAATTRCGDGGWWGGETSLRPTSSVEGRSADNLKDLINKRSQLQSELERRGIQLKELRDQQAMLKEKLEHHQQLQAFHEQQAAAFLSHVAANDGEQHASEDETMDMAERCQRELEQLLRQFDDKNLTDSAQRFDAAIPKTAQHQQADVTAGTPGSSSGVKSRVPIDQRLTFCSSRPPCHQIAGDAPAAEVDAASSVDGLADEDADAAAEISLPAHEVAELEQNMMQLTEAKEQLTLLKELLSQRRQMAEQSNGSVSEPSAHSQLVAEMLLTDRTHAASGAKVPLPVHTFATSADDIAEFATDPDVIEKLRQLNSARKKLAELQTVVDLIQRSTTRTAQLQLCLTQPDHDPEPQRRSAVPAANAVPEQRAVDEPEQRPVHGEHPSELPVKSDREKHWEMMQREQQIHLLENMFRKHEQMENSIQHLRDLSNEVSARNGSQDAAQSEAGAARRAEDNESCSSYSPCGEIIESRRPQRVRSAISDRELSQQRTRPVGHCDIDTGRAPALNVGTCRVPDGTGLTRGTSGADVMVQPGAACVVAQSGVKKSTGVASSNQGSTFARTPIAGQDNSQIQNNQRQNIKSLPIAVGGRGVRMFNNATGTTESVPSVVQAKAVDVATLNAMQTEVQYLRQQMSVLQQSMCSASHLSPDVSSVCGNIEKEQHMLLVNLNRSFNELLASNDVLFERLDRLEHLILSDRSEMPQPQCGARSGFNDQQGDPSRNATGVLHPAFNSHLTDCSVPYHVGISTEVSGNQTRHVEDTMLNEEQVGGLRKMLGDENVKQNVGFCNRPKAAKLSSHEGGASTFLQQPLSSFALHGELSYSNASNKVPSRATAQSMPLKLEARYQMPMALEMELDLPGSLNENQLEDLRSDTDHYDRNSPSGSERCSSFDALRELIYSEVAALISQNESRPHYLVDLFRRLQLLTTEEQRHQAVSAFESIVSDYLTDDDVTQKEQSSVDCVASDKWVSKLSAGAMDEQIYSPDPDHDDRESESSSEKSAMATGDNINNCSSAMGRDSFVDLVSGWPVQPVNNFGLIVDCCGLEDTDSKLECDSITCQYMSHYTAPQDCKSSSSAVDEVAYSPDPDHDDKESEISSEAQEVEEKLEVPETSSTENDVDAMAEKMGFITVDFVRSQSPPATSDDSWDHTVGELAENVPLSPALTTGLSEVVEKYTAAADVEARAVVDQTIPSNNVAADASIQDALDAVAGQNDVDSPDSVLLAAGIVTSEKFREQLVKRMAEEQQASMTSSDILQSLGHEVELVGDSLAPKLPEESPVTEL